MKYQLKVNDEIANPNSAIYLELPTAGTVTIPPLEEIKKLLTSSRGKNKGKFRASKPKNSGLIQYIWRMIRFHSGQDMCLPITASFDLQNWLKEQGFDDGYDGKKYISVCGFYDRHGNGKMLAENLDPVVDLLTKEFGLNPYSAAMRWGRELTSY